MARETGPPLLAYLHNARTCAEQAAALRSFKNDIVGHDQKKESWVTAGALPQIVRVLQASRSTAKADGRSIAYSADPSDLGEEETVRLQGLQVLASFANGGPAFIEPILSSGAGPAILANLSPRTNPPLVVVAALRALVNLAEATAQADITEPSQCYLIAEHIFAPESIADLEDICLRSGRWTLPVKEAPVTMVATLISRLCQNDKHALALADSAVLDCLANELAAFAVAKGYVVPGAEIIGRADGRLDFLPPPSRRVSNVAIVLEALTAIVSDSRYRACRLLCAPAIMAAFPDLRFSLQETLKPGFLIDSSEPEHAGIESRGPMDFLLPTITFPRAHFTAASHLPQSMATSSRVRSTRRPSISRSSSGKFGHGLPVLDASRFETSSPSGEQDLEDLEESPLIPWLIVLARNQVGIERLMAASLLTSLFKSGLGNRHLREQVVGVFVVPLLVQMLQKYGTPTAAPVSRSVEPSTTLAWKILERVPTTISRLLTDSEVLQKAAFDCGAVKILSGLLKNAYEPIHVPFRMKMWSPKPDTGMEAESSWPGCRLGSEPKPPLLVHRIRLRESALKAITSLAAGKDEYRKAFVEQDVIPYIVQSLSISPTKPSSPKEKGKHEEVDGPAVDTATSGYGANPLSVIIAACHAVRTHSRSISILRTSLVDHSVSLPILRFLRHPDVDVQIAATAAVCNLVTEVSPMRDELAEHGVMEVLCEHAHSHTAALRLNALWALKHFVNAVSPKDKKQCLEELESGWLVRLICDDTEDDALYRAKMEKQAQSGDDLDGDVDMGTSEAPAPATASRSLESPHSAENKPAPWALRAEAKKAAMRDAEVNPQRKARHDDLAIQEQGLDFIRNLISTGGSGISSDLPNESTELIDHLFTELGQDRFFDILGKKLQVKMLHGSAGAGPRRGASNGTSAAEARILYPQTKLIEAVIYILVHIAASIPRHRQLVIAQPGLLKLLSGHFGSKDKEVRIALCHLITNLTWQDDEADGRACALRAHELKKLGVMAKLEALEDDVDLDVRERAKVALWQMKQVSSV